MGIQINSSQDKIAFTIEVEKRLIEATGLHRKKHGTQFNPPEDLLKALTIWRVMAQRYKDDMTADRALSWHTAEEQKCEQEIAQYLVAKIHELKGMKSEEPYVPREFN